MLEQIKSILEEYQYKVGYSGVYSDEVMKKSIKQEKNLDKIKYFTLYDSNHRVIGRIHNLKEGDPFIKEEHLDCLTGYFTTFELPHREEIIEKIKSL